MTWWRITGVALLVASLALAMYQQGWRRGVRNWVEDLARIALVSGALAIVDVLAGHAAGWCTLPLVLVAAWFGQTSLGMLNFLLLQWFGVRLCRVVEWTETDGVVVTAQPMDQRSDGQLAAIAAGPGHLRDRDARVRVRWTILRWVWPLTGWWSEYRWIARRGGVR